MGLSVEEAELLLTNDLARCRNSLEIYGWFAALDLVRQDAIVELCFNMGLPRLFTFKKMIAALTDQDYTQARIELLDSRWAKQVQRERSHDLSFRIQFGRYQDES